MRCLAKEPGDRPQSMQDVAAELSFIEQDEGRELTSPAPTRWGRWVLLAGVAAAAGAAALFVNTPPVAPGATSPTPQSTPALPLPPPPPVTPKVVTGTLTSTPPGATVTRLEPHEDWGTTPLQRVVPKSADAVRLKFELKGYEPQLTEVRPNSDFPLDITMMPEKRPSADPRRPGPGKKKGKLTHDGVLDPFAP